MRLTTRGLAALVACVSLSGVALTASRPAPAAPQPASEGPPPTLQPKTYASPSGRYELRVDPSERQGGGPGAYAMTLDGERVWSAELPYTFWDAVVTDDGLAGGFAYTSGWRDYRAQGHFVVALLAPDGSERVKDVEERVPSRFFHSAPDPLAKGAFIHPELDRFVVRVRDPDVNAGDETWWTYRASTGERLGRVHPKQRLAASKVRAPWEAEALPGTPLTLVRWMSAELRSYATPRFMLLDEEYRSVWELALRADHAGNTTSRRVLRHGTFLEASGPGRFALWHVRASERVEYEAVQEAGSWTVREVRREPYSPPEEPEVEAPLIELEPLGAVELVEPDAVPPGPIRDVLAYTFRAEGVEFVRREPDNGRFTIVLVDEGGVPIHEQEVETAPQEKAAIRWFPLRAGWLVTSSEYGPGGTSKAWRVDSRSGALEPLDRFECPSVRGVAELPDGGLAVLATYKRQYTMSDALFAFEPDGTERWSVGEKLSDERKLFSPQDVTVTPDGRVVVVETIRNQLKVYAQDGTWQANVDLEEAWGQEPRYPAGVDCAPDGSLLVRDAATADPPVWRMRVDGTVLGRLTPRLPDGRRPERLPYGCRFAPDGTVWTKDDTRFLRLSEDGRVEHVIGAEPDVDTLDQPGDVLVDRLGRLCVMDRSDRAVHVFGADGRKLHVCRLEPDEAQGRARWLAKLCAGDDGGLYVPSGKRHVAFDRDGRRTGAVSLGRAPLFEPGNGRYWVVKSDYPGGDLELRDAEGNVVRTLRKNPDGTWLQGSAAVAPDGRLAIVGGGQVTVYSPTGDVLAFFETDVPIQTRRLTFAADWIVAASYGGKASLIRLDEQEVYAVQAPGASDSSWTFSIAPDGTELWAFTGQHRELHRFALPGS